MLRHLARFSLEESAALHLQSGLWRFWRVFSWLACTGLRSKRSKLRASLPARGWCITADLPVYCARSRIPIKRKLYQVRLAFIGQTLCGRNLGYLFLTEFFVDSFIGLVIWANLDPANLFVSPVSAPFAIGLAYATMVWGFADIAISTNLARDLGTRIVAAILWR